MDRITDITRRPPDVVMRLSRLGSFHQSRLSFMRVLTRRMAGESWDFTRPIFDIDQSGVGHAVYTAKGPARSYSLIAFAHDLPADKRSDRVIADAWDATFTLFDGVPTQADIDRLAQNVPLQEAGRVSAKELTLSRANRSVRLWSHVVTALANGRQPDVDQIDAVGYLMRTTAVYGSGKFGAADRETIADRPELTVPFQTEMLTVYLIRTFVRDLVQHMARVEGGDKAVALNPAIAQSLGIGNSTGLGMAPFIVNHPVLFNNWIFAREEAIARVRRVQVATADELRIFDTLFARVATSVGEWRSKNPVQVAKLADLHDDLQQIRAYRKTAFDGEFPWNRLWLWAFETLSEEGQELIASLILEPYPNLVDGLADCMADMFEKSFRIDGTMAVGDLRVILADVYGWAADIDWAAAEHCARAWYVSAEKLEPRLGERFEEPIAAFEQPLAPARDAVSLMRDLADIADETPVAMVLLDHPEHRQAVKRAQLTRVAPYGEIRDNTISAAVMPIDMLRAKLSFFGAIHFDPRSDRWVRICMYKGAPYPEDLSPETSDLWVYPTGYA
ncbi:hypothetical protein MWU61_17705 [Loktanella sp. F6476L]|uniref:hypothetical protein n=1 Tax=Loktanella sp. F6476L TaxID=2926405 RepID=UPI001FF4DE84|nr:hypothetical protein [Loktanella sp. F6476L]MCK0122395.1 hypothetical protein [Loktanella sp. F6476L]